MNSVLWADLYMGPVPLLAFDHLMGSLHNNADTLTGIAYHVVKVHIKSNRLS